MTPATVHMSTAFLTTLAGAAARSLVLGAFTAAALAACRVRSVRVKLFAWKGVLLAALAMPVLMAISPAIRVAVPIPSLPVHTASASVPQRAAVTADAALMPPASEIAPVKFLKKSARTHKRAQSATAPSVPQTSLETSIVPVVAPPFALVRQEVPWSLIILGAYLAIALALLVRVFIGMHFSRRLLRRATPVGDPKALEPLWLASDAAGLRSIPHLAESESVSVPVMVGISNPTILLTSGWQAWDADELAAVLAHEVSHIARRDALAQRLALLHRGIFWFSPLAWWLERRLADLAEQASDEAALAGGMDRTRYAEALLGFFAELEAGPERVWWQGVSMAKTGQAEKRVDRILAWRGAMSNKLTKSLMVALVLIAAPVVALTAAVRPAAYDVQAPPAPATPPSLDAPAASVAAPSPAPDPAQAPAAPTPGAAPAPPAAPAPSAALAPPADSEDVTPVIHLVVPPLPPIPSIHVEVPPMNVDVPPVHVDMPPVHVNVPPVHVQVPQIRIETHMLPAMPQQDITVEPPMTFSTSGDWNFYRGGHGAYWVGRYFDWGPRFAIVTKNSDDFMISGDRDDAEHARELKKKISGDFIWFERDEKSYVISDPATVDRAKQLWQPNEDLAKQQKELAKQQEDLAKQAEDARRKIEDLKIKVPDLSAEMQKVEEVMKKLNAEGGTMDEIGDLQRQMGEIEREIGEAERDAGRTAGMMGREQGEWGRKMGAIGRQQGQIGRKQAEQAREASRQMQQLLDDAVAKGLAKPE